MSKGLVLNDKNDKYGLQEELFVVKNYVNRANMDWVCYFLALSKYKVKEILEAYKIKLTRTEDEFFRIRDDKEIGRREKF